MDIVTLAAARKGGSGGDVTKQYVDEHLALKVDKIEGKSLSTNDYTNADKSTVGNSPIANSATGTSFSLTNAANAPLAGLVIEGRTTKTGDAITNVGDGGTLTLTSTNGTATKTATLFTGLPLCSLTGIKDAADFTAAVVHKRCKEIDLGTVNFAHYAQSGSLPERFAAKVSDMPEGTPAAQIIAEGYQTNNDYDLSSDKIISSINGFITIVDKQYGNDVSAFITAVTGKKAIYEIVEPYKIFMTASEVAAYHDLRTFENTTNITCTDSPQMNLNYMLNTENGAAIGNIQQQFINTVPMSMIAPAFSTTETYAVGDFVIYNYSLYKCTTAVQTAGAWDAASWTAATVADMLTA